MSNYRKVAYEDASPQLRAIYDDVKASLVSMSCQTGLPI